ncbi:CPBP family intramembrane metalloprotease [Rossellomorea marisflavi]|uniref:CPBP family intramembrane metalloprotease n=1 Tax=Rossellomorea marisflavi TaxID=189381 RepID=A0A5D4RU96_9BACI|nr:CPBP family intramembrane glutamic endopeptidase [Rossellomorea marisflavi]TYS54903.1 CPBP family intramembrane metalloprotease [Rossellomorea marisflavi]
MGSAFWKFKDAMIVLAINLVAGFVVADLFIKSGLSRMGLSSLEAGTIGGMFLAVVAFTTVYLWGVRKYSISWKVIGIFNAKKIIQHKKMILLYTFGALIVSLLLLFAMYSIIGVSPNSRSNAVDDTYLFAILLAVFSSVIVSPIYEEVLYRGFIYPTLRNRFGVKKAIVFSALIFSLVHLPSIDILPVNFVNGLVFAILYERTNSIYVPMVAHALFNLSLMTLVYLVS